MSRNLNLDEFSTYYGAQIEEMAREMNRSISSILFVNNMHILKINLIRKGTCISYQNREVRNGKFIDFEENVILNIGINEIYLAYVNSSLSLFECFNKVTTHEFLHVLFGDFSKTKLNRVFNYYNGSLKKDPEEDIYYNKTGNKYDQFGYKKIDHELYNIAADFIINREIGLEEPFMRAEDFGFDPELEVEQYYSLLMEGKEELMDKIKNGEFIIEQFGDGSSSCSNYEEDEDGSGDSGNSDGSDSSEGSGSDSSDGDGAESSDGAGAGGEGSGGAGGAGSSSCSNYEEGSGSSEGTGSSSDGSGSKSSSFGSGNSGSSCSGESGNGADKSENGAGKSGDGAGKDGEGKSGDGTGKDSGNGSCSGKSGKSSGKSGGKKHDCSTCKHRGSCSKINNSDKNEFESNSNTIAQRDGLDNIPISDERIETVGHEDLLEDFFLGKSRGFGPSSIDFIVRQLRKKNSAFIENTRMVINEMKDDIANHQQAPVAKTPTYFRFNNRKDDDDGIVWQGREKVKNNFSKDTERLTMPVLFIDCSGSMMDILKEVFYFCYNVLTYINCTIVFYDTTILKVISSASTLNFDPKMFLGGGTDLRTVLKQYKDEHNGAINNIYVFSDGYDDFSDLDVDHCTVFTFSKSGVTEKNKYDKKKK